MRDVKDVAVKRWDANHLERVLCDDGDTGWSGEGGVTGGRCDSLHASNISSAAEPVTASKIKVRSLFLFFLIIFFSVKINVIPSQESHLI